MKTRFNKPFESVQVKIPYETGMSPYSGLVDMAEKANILVKDGNRLRFGEGANEIKQFRKAWELNTDGCLDKVMANIASVKDAMPEETDAEIDMAVEIEEPVVDKKVQPKK